MNILILTDFSEIAENAENYVLELWQNTPSDIYLLNIGVFHKEQSFKTISEQKQRAIENLCHHVNGIQQENDQHNFHAIFREDNVINATRKLVDEKKIDLIVMGATGKDYQQNPILGSHTYELMKKVNCNVLAVPKGCHFTKPEKMIIPIDYSVMLNNKVFNFLEKQNKLWNPKIEILEIQNSSVDLKCPVNSRKGVVDQLNNNGIKHKILDEKTTLSKNFLSKIQGKFDIVTILGRNLNIFDKLLHAKHGLFSSFHNDLPILVLHG